MIRLTGVPKSEDLVIYYSPIPYLFEPLYIKKSKYQTIEFGKFIDSYSNPSYALLLNKDVQFVTPWEKIYHFALVDKAIRYLKRKPKRVLILGGGDGLAIRNVLKYNPDEVILIEIDKDVVNLFKYGTIPRKINKNAFWNKKVKIIIGDAFKAPYLGLGKFDLIIVDLTDPDKLSKHIYFKQIDFIEKLIKMLKKGGVLSAYNMPMLQYFSSIQPFKTNNIPYMGLLRIYYYKKEG